VSTIADHLEAEASDELLVSAEEFSLLVAVDDRWAAAYDSSNPAMIDLAARGYVSWDVDLEEGDEWRVTETGRFQLHLAWQADEKERERRFGLIA